MYNRRTAELAAMRRQRELDERGIKQSRQEMIDAAAKRTLRQAALAASYHGRVENWLGPTASDVDNGTRPQSPDYQTKKLAAHHRFRDRDMSKEIGNPHISAFKQDKSTTAMGEPLFSSERQRIASTRAMHSRSLLLEGYQQPNELPTHIKYPLRGRRKRGELGPPMKFSSGVEAERILDSTERNAMLETHGDYQHVMHASKYDGLHVHRADGSTAPHYREYNPKKWQMNGVRRPPASPSPSPRA